MKCLISSRRENFGEDLLALNIQRGRDHGLPSYDAFRHHCGLRRLGRGWQRRPDELSEEYWTKLRDVYDSPQDIDLYVGAVGEANVAGGVVGPTFACLIGEQFSRMKKGDRFFYTHTRRRGGRGLGPVAREQVLRRTLGDIMCGVTSLDALQKWVTLQPNNDYNELEACAVKATLDTRAIAQEIAFELDNDGILSRPTQPRRELVRSGPPARDSLLLRQSASFSADDAISRPLPQEHIRVRHDFTFPHEEGETTRKSNIINRRVNTVNHRESKSSTAPSSSSSESVLLNRLSSKPRFGVSTHACLFKLCPLNSDGYEYDYDGYS